MYQYQYKPKIISLTLSFIFAITFAANYLLANNSIINNHNNHTIEKLAEYNAEAILPDLMGSEYEVFQDILHQFKLERADDGTTNLVITKLISQYSNFSRSIYNFGRLVPAVDEEALDDIKTEFAQSNDVLYMLLINTNDSVRNNKNLLFKSQDGLNWKLFKTFPAEWELSDLEASSNNLSVTCMNCEDQLKPSYIISNDQGATWKKYSLPEAATEKSFSGITNSKLFALGTARDQKDRDLLFYELLHNDITTKTGKWLKADIRHLLTLKETYKSQQLNFKFNSLDEIFDLDNLLIANVEYVAKLSEEDEDSPEVTKYFLWLSEDNGSTWRKVDLDLGDDDVFQFSKHGDTYHLVTSVNLNNTMEDFFDNFDDNDFESVLSALVYNFFNFQKYSYYELTLDKLLGKETSQLTPKFEFNHAYGGNLVYKTTAKAKYTDALLLDTSNDEIKLRVYRLFD